MAEKTKFSNLISGERPIAKDQRACVNCKFSRTPEKMEVVAPYVLCKKGPPSVLIEPAGMGTNQLKVANRWPAMGLGEECGSFEVKSDSKIE